MSAAIDIAAPFIKQFEGCILTAYQDSVGVWTIGFGATGSDVHQGLVWTQAQADTRLGVDLAKAETAVRRAISVAMADKQIAALISIVFNVGPGCLNGTQLQLAVNQHNWIQAAKEICRWDHAGGQELKGLLIRRLEEAAMFLRGS